MKRPNRLISSLLAALMLLACAAPALCMSDGSIVIHNEKEFAQFAKKCKTDTWSQGKTFRLVADIDLSHTEFSPVPTFGGEFDGNGYTISGIKITSKGSNLALFRYIQKSGIVENLNVNASVAPKGSKRTIGGICGENSGAIVNCTFDGDVSGETNTGGICGYVTESGRVSGCVFNGSAVGNSYTGGICGQNCGFIENCENNGSINTVNSEKEKSIQDIKIDISEIGTTENIDACTDTGGICGFSKGTITGCKNFGNVGYKSIGYNTGGICGRQSGIISECENYGDISGRKDVGGIAGQAEPYILLEYTQDVLEQIDAIFREMQDTVSDKSLTSDKKLSDSFDRVSDKISDTSLSLENILTDTKNYAGDVTDEINRTADRIHNAVNSSPGVFDSISSGTDKLSEAVSYLEQSTEGMSEITDAVINAQEPAEKAKDRAATANHYLEKALKNISSACDDLSDFSDSLSEGAKSLKSAVSALSKALKNKRNIESGFADVSKSVGDIQSAISGTGSTLSDMAQLLRDMVEKGYISENIRDTIDNLENLAMAYREIAAALKDIFDACSVLADSFDIYSVKSAFSMLAKGFDNLSTSLEYLHLAVVSLSKALDELEGTGDIASSSISNLKSALSSTREAMDYLTDGIKKLSDISNDLASDEKFSLPSSDDVFGDDYDVFTDNFHTLRDELDKLKDILSDKNDILSDKFDNLTDEMSSLADILSDAYNDSVRADDDGFVEDISDLSPEAGTRGTISRSSNYGLVCGDINTGGIVGSMAVEYDFDPEDDIKNSGDKTLKFTYKTKCTVLRCKNENSITGKKNCSGGIVGRMDLGSVLSCENYANVSSNDGDYTGGIAGLSDTAIRGCAVKCEIKGSDYVGGIAGKGESISGCASLVSIPEYGEKSGCIAGEAPIEDLEGNFFVSDILGAVDDINYTSHAEEADVSSFVSFVKSRFGSDVSFTLTFVADGKTIAEVPFNYRDSIPGEKIPNVPEKKGFYGKWSEYDFGEARFDAQITAQYYRDIDLIKSDLRRKDGKSVVIVCGAFNDEAAVTAAKCSQIPDKLNNSRLLDSFEIKLDSVHTQKHTIRYLPTGESGRIKIYTLCGGKLKRVKTKRFGSYLEFQTSGEGFSIYEVKSGYLPFAAAGILILAAIGAFLFCRKTRESTRPKR